MTMATGSPGLRMENIWPSQGNARLGNPIAFSCSRVKVLKRARSQHRPRDSLVIRLRHSPLTERFWLSFGGLQVVTLRSTLCRPLAENRSANLQKFPTVEASPALMQAA